MREYRLAARMAAKQLGSMLHLRESSITMYETGKREPSPDTLVMIADILGTTVDALLGRQTEPEENKKPAAENHELSESERELIRLLEHVPEERKAQVLAYIEASLGCKERFERDLHRLVTVGTAVKQRQHIIFQHFSSYC